MNAFRPTSPPASKAKERPSTFRWTHGLLNRLVRASDVVMIVAAMGTMTIIVTAQVFWRHVLNSSIDSADEVSRLLFVWAMFLAIPHGIKYGVHVGIDLLVGYLRPALREAVFRLMAAASGVLMIAVFMAAWIATEEKWQQLMPTIPVTASIFYIAILICALHSIMHLALYAWGGSSIWGGRTL